MRPGVYGQLDHMKRNNCNYNATLASFIIECSVPKRDKFVRIYYNYIDLFRREFEREMGEGEGHVTISSQRSVLWEII